MYRSLATLVLVVITGSARAQDDETLDAAAVARFAERALDCIHREYPNKIAHVMNSDEDVRSPQELTPVFYGCFDWHSAVHGHWMLVRLLRLFPDLPEAGKIRTALDANLSAENILKEVQYLQQATTAAARAASMASRVALPTS